MQCFVLVVVCLNSWAWQHSVSEGELRENLNTLDISGESQAVSVKDRRLYCTNPEEETRCELQDEEGKESQLHDVIMEDFSNSMITCWSFRAKALLQLNMVRCLF